MRLQWKWKHILADCQRQPGKAASVTSGAVLGTGNGSPAVPGAGGDAQPQEHLTMQGRSQASLITAGAKVILCHCCICKATKGIIVFPNYSSASRKRLKTLAKKG